jgi:peptidase M1-like protein
MRAVLLPLLVATVACPSPPARVEPRADRPRYVVNVRVTRPFRTVNGDLTVTFTPNRPTNRLVFRLWPNGPTQLRTGSRLDVGAVSVANMPVRTSRPDPTTLTLQLGRRAAGSPVTVHVPWRLRLPSTHQDRIARFGGGLRLGTFLPLLAWDPRRGWLTDPPARILGETAATPAADFDLHVRVPSGLRVVATGVAVGAGHFRAHAVRDIAVAVGPFRMRSLTDHGVTLRVASTTSSAASARSLAFARRALRVLGKRYGPYPWPTYTVVVPPDLPTSGIEYPMLSFMGGAGNYTRLIIDHETAHQWFYSLVGNDQARDPWLDETLATWAQTRLGSPEFPAGRHVPAGVARHVGASMAYWDRHEGWYFYGVYGEGVKALRSLGNDDAVDCALRRYVARRAYTIAQPGDFLDELNRVIPGAERRLRAWGIRR